MADSRPRPIIVRAASAEPASRSLETGSGYRFGGDGDLEAPAAGVAAEFLRASSDTTQQTLPAASASADSFGSPLAAQGARPPVADVARAGEGAADTAAAAVAASDAVGVASASGGSLPVPRTPVPLPYVGLAAAAAAAVEASGDDFQSCREAETRRRSLAGMLGAEGAEAAGAGAPRDATAAAATSGGVAAPSRS